MASSKHFSAKMWAKKEINLLGNKVTGRRFFQVPLLLVILFLSSCVTLPDPETTQDFSKDLVASLSAGQTVGQTFVSRRERLNGIDLWLQTDQPGTPFTVELFHNIEDQNPIFSGEISARNDKTRIEIPPLADPANQTYYLRLSNLTNGVNLLGRNEDIYFKGTATINDQPIEADLAFRASYDYDAGAAFSDLRGLLSIWYLTLPLGIVLLLPGWLLLDFTGIKEKFDGGERVALSLGISLTIIPLLMLWTSFLGLQWGPISVWLVAGGMVILLIWRSIKLPNWRRLPSFRIHPSSLILAAIFGVTLFTRFAMVRDLAAPPWVDSIHHGLITRLMLESGAIPDTYAPYLPVGADYYHFGFHSALASFTWLTGLEIPEGMLIFGQVLNAMIVFAVYLLAKTLTQNRPAALTAALISGLFTLMPAYFVSWGRYTQLAGLLVLPAAFAIWVEISKTRDISPNKNISLWLIGPVLFAGQFLIHYRVAAFLGAMILAYLLAQIKLRRWPKNIGQSAILGVFAAILLLPWLPGTFADLLLPKGQAWTGGKDSFSQIPWNFLEPALGETALIMAGIGLVLGLILLKRFPITILLWTGMMYLFANMGIFKLPGSGFVNPVSMEITLFMPIAVMGGYAVGGTLELSARSIPERWRGIPRVGFVILGAVAAIFGAQRLLPTLNPITFLAREADFPAIQWIAENIPAGETILINPTAWGYGLYMGNDGGYWISALSDHQTMPPPVLYGLGETAEKTEINQTIEGAQSNAEDAAALWELMQIENIDFVYTGVRGGVISPHALAESNLFKVRYQQDGTWVFEAVNNAP